MIKKLVCKNCGISFEGYHNKLFCNNCVEEKEKQKYWLNRDICLLRHRRYINRMKKDEQWVIKEKNYDKQYYLKNHNLIREKQKQYMIKNHDKIRQTEKENYIKNHKYIMKKRRINNTKRYINDINFKVKHILSCRIRAAIAKNIKKGKTQELIGCSINELKQHLEKQFQPGMNWSNYCYSGWHIDHIIPCSKFDLSKEEQQKKCFHYSNLQPLWMKENFKKSDK